MLTLLAAHLLMALLAPALVSWLGRKAYLVLALLRPRWSPATVAALALAACLAVEGFQATGIPAMYADAWVVRWLLGTTFAWHDVGCYLVGVGLAAAADGIALRVRR